MNWMTVAWPVVAAATGMELFRELVASKSRTSAIFITAFDDPAIRAEAEVLRCAGFYRKSAPDAKIIEAIRRAIHRKQ